MIQKKIVLNLTYREDFEAFGCHQFKVSELLTTKKLESAMALPATMGDRYPNAAMGIPIVLKAKAQNKFC